MARNGSGVYSLPAGSIVATGDDILPAQHNDPLNDIASDLNAIRPISSGGTGASSAAGALTAFGITSTVAELNYSDGVTSNIQTQLNGKLSNTLTATANLDTLSGNVQFSFSHTATGAPNTGGSYDAVGYQLSYAAQTTQAVFLSESVRYIRTDDGAGFTDWQGFGVSKNPTFDTSVSVDGPTATIVARDTDNPMSGSFSSSVRFNASDGEAGSVGHITSSNFYVRSQNKPVLIESDVTDTVANSNVLIKSDNANVAKFDTTEVFTYVPLTVTGTVDAARVQLNDTVDVTLTSTNNAIQIGPTAGTNMVMDPNEIQARNGVGVAAQLNLNIAGGTVGIASTGQTTTVNGPLVVNGGITGNLPASNLTGTVPINTLDNVASIMNSTAYDGALVFARYTGTGEKLLGATAAGSLLEPSAASGFSAATTLAGTYACRGYVASAGSADDRTSQWVRIA